MNETKTEANSSSRKVAKALQEHRDAVLRGGPTRLKDTALELLHLALSGQTFSTEDLAETVRILGPLLIELITDSYQEVRANPSPSSPPALAIASAFAREATRKVTLNMPYYTTNRDNLPQFLDDHPTAARAIIRTATHHTLQMNISDFLLLAPHLDKEDYPRLRPHDVGTLRNILSEAPDITPQQFKDMVLGLTNNDLCNYHQGVISELAGHMPAGAVPFMLENFKKIFKSNQINLDFAMFVLGLPQPTPELTLQAIRKLSLAAHPCNFQLRHPFAIPPEESAEGLCRMLIYLDACPTGVKEHLRGLPDEESFRTRTIELQMEDDKSPRATLFRAALEARDSLQTKILTGQDSITQLQDAIQALCEKWERPEIDFLRHLRTANQELPDDEALGMLTRMICLTSANCRTRWQHEMDVTLFWGAPLNERTAHRLVAALQQMSLAQPAIPQ